MNPDGIAEIDRLLAEVMGPPRLPPSPPRVRSRSLDAILGSRTHVRVVRVLVEADPTNPSSRAIARRAVVSHGRVLEVLRQLASAGFVSRHSTATHVMYRLRPDHPLNPPVRSLFNRERRAADG
jgi:hypothetical protein